MKARDGREDIAQGLIRCAARNAPPQLSERLQEEWSADLAARPGAWARVRFALGCCWAARVLQYEAGAAAAASTSAACATSGNKVVMTSGHHDAAFFSRRTLILVLIIALHAALIYGFANGLAHTMVVAITTPLETIVTESLRHHDEPPPPPAPKFAPPHVDVPVPDLSLDASVDPDRTTIITAPESPPQPPAVTSARTVSRVVGGPGKGFPNTDDYYPMASRRLGETGVATVHACVDLKGVLSGEPTIVQSSGSARLDQGALKLAQAGSGHYRPTTEDGAPVSSCYAFRVRFTMRD
jgi:TonB family protein